MPRPICTSEENQSGLLEAFLAAWPIERLERMTLEEYSRTQIQNPDNFRESFCYYLERLTPGGIGGSNSSKFHIWAKADPSKPVKLSTPVLDDGRYCWLPAYGKTSAEAFETIRNEIVQVAKAARAGDLNKVEASSLRQLIKWKIAFLYQDPANPTVVGCFTRDPLEAHFNATSSTTTADLHRKAIEEAAPGESMQDIGYRIWLESQDDETTVYSVKESGAEGFGARESVTTKPYQKLLNTERERHYPTDNPRAHYWLYSVPKPGSAGDMAELLKNGVMIYDFLPEKSFEDVFRPEANTKEWMAFAFAKAIQIGDVIVAHEPSTKNICAVGIVTGDYVFTPLAAPHARHSRKVEWIPDSAYPGLSGGWSKWPLTSMNRGDIELNWGNAMKKLMTKANLPMPTSFQTPSWSPLGDMNLRQGTFSNSWSNAETKPVLRILYGPPGTGKTYSTSNEVLEICLESKPSTRQAKSAALAELRQRGNVEFVTFHQNYDYSDFVEGYRPKTIDGKMAYVLCDGILKRLADRASRYPNQPFVLIIDEINRGNISKIFGELITLIEHDKRIGADNELRVTLPLSGESFCLPRNLSVVGTMNTADRSIALLDTAIRRRFDFVRMPPNPTVLSKNGEPKLATLLRAINRMLKCEMLGPDHRIGHAWLMGTQSNNEKFKKALENKILPLLEEWFYGVEESDSDSPLETIRSTLFDFNAKTESYTAKELDVILGELKGKKALDEEDGLDSATPKK